MNEKPEDDKTLTHVPLTSGTKIGAYRLIRELGRGGMGEVFLAEDTSLDRQVALKFLPPSVLSDSELRTRFTREAKAVAKVNHPNVVTIYEVGEHNGRPFFAMEYVTGQTLDQLVRSEQRPISWIVEIAIQLCQGLGEAHRAGIVHRDIKTSNIYVDDSMRVRILDFGLANMSGDVSLTKSGSTLGTVSYMSPEQVSGRTVDVRSDLFSLGVVLHEMLTGSTPFRRDSEGATLNAIMQSQVPSVKISRPETPDLLATVVSKLLEKDVELRYQTAEGVLADLKRLLYDSNPSITSGGRESVEDRSVVVIPFVNMSPDPDNEYFSDGLTEEIIADLSGIGTMRVLSRSTSMSLKGTDKSVRAIGQQLGIRYILSGSVRRAGNNVRIMAQLVEAASDRQIWAEKYKGTLDDIFEIQESVSQAIVSTLKVRLTSQEKEQLQARPIQDARAYEFYLRANVELETVGGLYKLESAEKYLRRALEIEGDNATLYAGLAYVYLQHVNFGFHGESHLQQAKDFVQRALALDPNTPRAHLVRGLISDCFDGKPKESRSAYYKALELSPNDSVTMTWLAIHYATLGYPDKSEEFIRRVEHIDPLSPSVQMAWGHLKEMSGKLEERCEELKAAFEKNPSDPADRWRYIRILAMSGQVELVRDLMTDFPPEHLDRATAIGARMTQMLVFGLLGEKEKALSRIDDALYARARQDPEWAVELAEAYVACGVHETALDLLEDAFDHGFAHYRFLTEYRPVFKPLHSNLRFKDIVARMKDAFEAAEV